MPDKTTDPVQARDSIAQAYSSEPWWYDLRGFGILTFAYRSTLWAQVRFFGENIRRNHLEIAIGTGTLFDIILKWRKWKKLAPAHITGIDYAAPMLAGAMHRFAKNPDIELAHADVGELPYSNDTFDSANIANAVHCFPDVDAAFRETLRVLKPGGLLALNVLLYARGARVLRSIANSINSWGMRKGILVTPYEQEDVRRRLTTAGFELIRENVAGNTYNVLARKPG
jgi:ubiquinone/menaquinone biosynthesis C-methylase UbiE